MITILTIGSGIAVGIIVFLWGMACQRSIDRRTGLDGSEIKTFRTMTGRHMLIPEKEYNELSAFRERLAKEEKELSEESSQIQSQIRGFR